MLHNNDSTSNNHSLLSENQAEANRITLFTGMKSLLKYSIPTMATYLLQSSIDFINLFFVGRMGSPDYTAALGLGILWVDVICVSILMGMTTFLETVGTQLFGSKDLHGLGVAHNKARVFITLCVIPLTIALWFTENILLLVGMNPSICHMAGSFTRALVPSYFLLVQIESTKKYLQVQTYFYQPMIINLVASLLHPIWCVLLIPVFENKLIGIAHAKNISNALTLILMVTYIKCSNKFHKSWFLPTRETFNEIKKFFTFAFYGVIMTCLEWWAFEILCLFAGKLDNISLATNIAIVNLNMLYYMFPLGIGLSTATLIGISIGEQEKKNAQVYAKCAVILNTLIIGIISLLMLLFGNLFAAFFSADKDVQALIKIMLPILVVEEMVDTNQTILGKVLIGAGMQEKTSWVTLISYYGVMVPMGYILCNVIGWGIYGLWISTCVAMLIMALYEMKVVLKIDWNELVMEICAKKLAEYE
jgi:MATE family multidrug resistance protein